MNEWLNPSDVELLCVCVCVAHSRLETPQNLIVTIYTLHITLVFLLVYIVTPCSNYPRRSRSAIGVDIVFTLDVCMLAL